MHRTLIVLLAALLSHPEGLVAGFHEAMESFTEETLRAVHSKQDVTGLSVSKIAGDRLLIVVPQSSVSEASSSWFPWRRPVYRDLSPHGQVVETVAQQGERLLKRLQENPQLFALREMIFSGTGRGGDVALYLAFQYASQRNLLPSPIKVCTFFPKGCGDKAFYQAAEEKLGAGNILHFETYRQKAPYGIPLYILPDEYVVCFLKKNLLEGAQVAAVSACLYSGYTLCSGASPSAQALMKTFSRAAFEVFAMYMTFSFWRSKPAKVVPLDILRQALQYAKTNYILEDSEQRCYRELGTAPFPSMRRGIGAALLQR